MKSAHTEVSRRPAHDTLTEVMLSCTEITIQTLVKTVAFIFWLEPAPQSGVQLILGSSLRFNCGVFTKANKGGNET